MARLVRTVKAGNQHQHFAYLSDSGQSMTSKAKGHQHQVFFNPPQSAMMGLDPVTNQEYELEPAQPGGWMIIEAEGHTHELGEEYAPQTSERKIDDETLVEEILTLYRKAKKREEDCIKKGHAAEDLLRHDQWDDGVRETLFEQNRACITVNMIEQKIDNLSGYQRQNRQDIKFFPTEGGDQRISDMLYVLVKNLLENCDFQREETAVFEDAATPGRGFFNAYTNFDKNIMGDIIVERFPWDNVHLGPHEKMDLSDCDYLIPWKWYSKAKLGELYPDKIKELVPGSGEIDDLNERDSKLRKDGDDLVDVASQNYKLIECWRKEYKRGHILVNADDEFVFKADGWSDAEVSEVKTISGFTSIVRTTHRIRVSKMVNYKLLETGYPDLAWNDFMLIPMYAKFYKGEWHGKVEGVKDLQFLVNKCFSQFVDILNKCVNTGHFYDSETFESPEQEALWLKNATSPGFNQRVTNSEKPPKRAEPVDFPKELAAAIQIFSDSMRQVMNINLESLGQGGQDQSGVAMRQKILQQLLGNDFIFDNLSFAKKKLGRLLVAMIQQVYTPERIMRVLFNEHNRQFAATSIPGKPAAEQQPQGVMVGGQPLTSYDPQDIMELLQNADLTKYDVVVSESPSAPSAMMGNFLMMLEMAAKGIALPPEAILAFAPIPETIKESTIAQVQSAAKQQTELENKKYDVELEKARIAAQNTPAQGPQGGLM